MARRVLARLQGKSAVGRGSRSRPAVGSLTRALLLAVFGLAGIDFVAQEMAPQEAAAHEMAEPNPPVVQPTPPAYRAPLSIGPAPQAAPSMEWLRHKTADGSHPDGNEQMLVWLMNRARWDPTAEGMWLSATGDADIEGAINFFGVDLDVLQSDFAGYDVRSPAAFDSELYEASRLHCLDLIDRDAQDHNGQLALVQASDFDFNGARLSVFSFARSALHAHGALNVDWGTNPPTGVQDPPGHRQAIMDIFTPTFMVPLTNVGLAVVPEQDAGTQVGPLVFAGVYVQGAGAEHNRFLVGTVWDDLNANDTYDPGEGLAGVTVMPDFGTYFAVTGDAGGYAIPIEAPDSYTVTFSGGALGAPVQAVVAIGATSELLDVIASPEPALLLGQALALALLGGLARLRARKG